MHKEGEETLDISINDQHTRAISPGSKLLTDPSTDHQVAAH